MVKERVAAAVPAAGVEGAGAADIVAAGAEVVAGVGSGVALVIFRMQGA